MLATFHANRKILPCQLNGAPNLASRLELAGIGNARLWLDMQSAYELAQVRSKETPQGRAARRPLVFRTLMY